MVTSSYDASASTSSASSSPLSAAEGFSGDALVFRTDQMVKTELEVAEALAGLAHSSVRGGCESGGKWGNKGKRARNRVKTGSQDADSGKKPEDSVPSSSDLAQDQVVLDEQRCEHLFRNAKMKVKTEKHSELPNTSRICSKGPSSFGGSRSRQNLTEAEKEERRIRRILANRESARQTIRRRQAICDELTRKAANLSMENTNLKRMARPIKSEAEETATPAHAEISASPSANSPFLLYNHPLLTPFTWPPIIRSSNPVQLRNGPQKATEDSPQVSVPYVIQSSSPVESRHDPQYAIAISPRAPMPNVLQSSYSVESQHELQNAIAASPRVPVPYAIQSFNPVQSQHEPQNTLVISPAVPMPVFGNLSCSNEQENPSNINGPKTPIYILPYPFFIPLHDHRIGVYQHPSVGLKDKQDEISANDPSNGILSAKATHVDNHSSSSTVRVKTEAYCSEDAKPDYNLNETPLGFPPDGGWDEGGQHLGAHPNGMIFKPAPINPAVSAFTTTKHENGQLPEFPLKEATSPLPGKKQLPVAYPSKTPEDLVAAAEARKRRKELTRLKNLRPFRINS